jgi:hypothetical protein
MTEPTEYRSFGAHKTLSQERPPQINIPLICIAAVALGFAIQFNNGEYSRGAIALVSVALIASALALANRLSTTRLFDGATVGVLLTGVLLQLATLFNFWPGVDLPHHGGSQLLPFYAGILVAGAIVLWAAFGKLPRALPTGLLVATFLFLGFWMVHSSPQPHIDVWVFQQEGASALLQGQNPYAMTFPDIYHSTAPGAQPVYGQGLVVNDRLQFGFPYPPVSLILATIGYAVAGDHRYAQLVALALAGLFIAANRGRISILAAALLLFTPRVFFVIGRAWTEPFVVLLLAATIFCAARKSKWLPVALGLLLAGKQYLLLGLPLTFFLLPPGWRWVDWFRLLWKSAVVAIVVTAPFVLWDFHAFWKSTVAVQGIAPFRWDALSYLVWYGFLGHGHLVTEPSTALFWSTFAALAALGFALWKAPRTPAGFAAALSLISLAFFAFNKQAFCNYYFFVIGAICCALGESDSAPVVFRYNESRDEELPSSHSSKAAP